MTDRKTLNLRDTSAEDAPPALKKRGRGWEISDKRLDVLHEQAREKRRFSSEAHKLLAKRFADADMGRYTFKRHAVVGSAIVDFNCHPLGMAIMIEEEDDNEALSKRRDKSLDAVGIRVMRIKAADILDDIDPVLKRITAGMRMRIGDRRDAARAHREANPNQDYPTRRHDNRDESQTRDAADAAPAPASSAETSEPMAPETAGEPADEVVEATPDHTPDKAPDETATETPDQATNQEPDQVSSDEDTKNETE